MNAPPPLLVTMMSRIIPPPAREAVIGDLWETCRSPADFVRQGFAVLPFLILSQLRRRSSWPMLGLQAYILFACLHGFAPPAAVPAAWLRALPSTLAALVALAWHDTYAKEGAAGQAMGEAAGVVVAIAVSQLLAGLAVGAAGLDGAWLLSRAELLAAASALPILCLLRWGSRLARGGGGIGEGELEQDYARFRTRVRRRNRLEIAAILATLLISGAILACLVGRVPPLIGTTLFGFLCLLVYLACRGGAPAPAAEATAEEVRRLFHGELLRQSRLRSLSVWWWLSPLFVGLAMNLVRSGGLGTAQASLGLLLILGLAACIGGFNAERNAGVRRLAQRLGTPAPR